MGKRLRLFWAINLPEELKTKLSRVQDGLRKAGADAKWVEPGNLHLTVKFLGETDPGLVAPVIGTVSCRLRDCRAFWLEVAGLGFFPGPASPRVVWAGLKGKEGLLEDIGRIVDESMAVHGFPRENRKFSPHLTLARIRSPKNRQELIRLVDIESPRTNGLGNFKVSSVDLMQSNLTPQGPVYTLLSRVGLQ